jgi:hypothetical protein
MQVRDTGIGSYLRRLLIGCLTFAYATTFCCRGSRDPDYTLDRFVWF